MSDSRIIKPGQQLTKGGRYNISRDEAVSIAVQIGQEVYDHVADEHKKSMELLLKDINRKLDEIRGVTASNILDLQRRSFGFAVAYDLRRARAKIEEWYWTLRYRFGWVPDDGLIGGIEPDPGPEEPEPENVGAPTEQPLLTEESNNVIQQQPQAIDGQDKGSDEAERIDRRQFQSREARTGQSRQPGLNRVHEEVGGRHQAE